MLVVMATMMFMFVFCFSVVLVFVLMIAVVLMLVFSMTGVFMHVINVSSMFMFVVYQVFLSMTTVTFPSDYFVNRVGVLDYLLMDWNFNYYFFVPATKDYIMIGIRMLLINDAVFYL